MPFKLKKSFSRLYFDLERLSSRVAPISGYLKNKRQNTVDATDTCRFKGIDGSWIWIGRLSMAWECVSSFTDQVPVEFKGIVYVLTRQLCVAYKIEGAV